MNAPDRKLTDLRINPEWTKLPIFDRSGWRTMQFGEFAESINERVEPTEAADEIYVGLEHLDSDSLHLRRWGKGSDVTGTKLRFRKGDIIFGRRRAYQRKLAVAEFDGICSAHAMVVRAKPRLALAEFLPFVVLSDRFMSRAGEISVGSLSPTINWTALKLEKFDLPPLDQQRRISKLLLAIDNLLETRNLIAAQAAEFPRHIANYVTGLQGDNSNRFEIRSLGDVADVVDCKHRTPAFAQDGVPVISPGSIKWGPLRTAGCNRTTEAEYGSLMNHCTPREWDLVMGRNQSFGIASFIRSNDRFVLGQDTVLIQPRQVTGQYVYLALQSSFMRSQIDRMSVGSTFKRVNLKDIRSLRIPQASAEMQEEASRFLLTHHSLTAELTSNTSDLTKLRRSLWNTVFSER